MINLKCLLYAKSCEQKIWRIIARLTTMAALNWIDAEVFQLISCWAEEGIQEQFEGCKHRHYSNISGASCNLVQLQLVDFTV